MKIAIEGTRRRPSVMLGSEGPGRALGKYLLALELHLVHTACVMLMTEIPEIESTMYNNLIKEVL